MIVFAVRHGHRADDPTNPDGKWLPKGRDLDPDISPIGMKMAEQTGQRLKDERIKQVYCSPFLRAVRTASLIVSQFDDPKPNIRLEWGVCEHLNPMYFKDWPGTIAPQKLAQMFPLVDPDSQQTGILPDCPEEYWPMHDRVCKTTNMLIHRHPGENILIVAHAATVCAIAPGLAGWQDYQPRGYLCGIHKIVKQGPKWMLEMNGDVSHLDWKGL